MSFKVIFGRILKISVVASVVSLALLTARYISVQSEIKNAPIEISEYSTSGYTPPGVYGHGNLMSDDGTFGWYIYDINDPEHEVRKACVNNTVPKPDWDIDFIYSNGQWYKLRSGLGRITADGFQAEPATQVWKGVLSTKMTFPVRKPDLPYRAKILFSKLKNGTQSPLDYLQGLKSINPTCANIPAP